MRHHEAILITPTSTILAMQPGALPDIKDTPEDYADAGAAGLAARTARLFKDHGVVLLSAEAADALNVTDWQTHGSNPKVYLGRLDQLDGHQVDANVLDIVTTVALYGELMGVPYHRSPGVAGLTLLTALYPKGKTKRVDWESDGPSNGFEAPYHPRDWRPVTPPYLYKHNYDKRRSGLGTLSVLEVARTALVHRPEQRTFDPKMAGWWYCEVPPWNDDRLPNPAGYGSSPRWLTHPTINLLNSLAEQGRSQGIVHIHGSWSAPKSRLFYRWAEITEAAYQKAAKMALSVDPDGTPSALAQDAGRVVEAIKDTYREMPGMWASALSWNKRPDWFAAKIALERSNAWRVADQVGQMTGRWPVAVDGDRWTYGSDDRDAVASSPTWTGADEVIRGIVIGDQLGQWRVMEAKQK